MPNEVAVRARRVPFEAIPVVDLGPWFEGDEKAHQELARQLSDICQNVGFFYVGNHGLSQQRIADTFKAAIRFFALPEDRQTTIHFTKARKQRGYIPLRAESSDPDARGDVKEALDFTFPTPPKDVNGPAAFRMVGPNLWPSSLPGFRQTIEEYFQEMIGLGRSLSGTRPIVPSRSFACSTIHLSPSPSTDPTWESEHTATTSASRSWLRGRSAASRFEIRSASGSRPLRFRERSWSIWERCWRAGRTMFSPPRPTASSIVLGRSAIRSRFFSVRTTTR